MTSGLHTRSQVAVGGLAGGCNGALWAVATTRLAPHLARLLPNGRLGVGGSLLLILLGAAVVGGFGRRRAPDRSHKRD